MMLEWFDISGHEPTMFNRERYENEKQREKLIARAKEDAVNSPNADLWIVDITPTAIISFPLEEA
jgi:nicotinamide mononucleotide adenylyltransferase